jgi:hypothetical protein
LGKDGVLVVKEKILSRKKLLVRQRNRGEIGQEGNKRKSDYFGIPQ